MISRGSARSVCIIASRSFNLVIEVLLISSKIRLLAHLCHLVFQSRNRGSFDFKQVILEKGIADVMFQSRNRGSFDFKCLPPVDKHRSLEVSIS